MLQEILKIVRGQERRIDQIEKSQTIEEMTRKVDREMVRRMLDPSAALKEGLATMNFDSVLSRRLRNILRKRRLVALYRAIFRLRKIMRRMRRMRLLRIMAEINKNKNLYAKIKAEMDKRKAKGVSG